MSSAERPRRPALEPVRHLEHERAGPGRGRSGNKAQRSDAQQVAALELLGAAAVDSGLVPLSEGLANEFRISASLMGTPNQIEAVTARLQKREAKYADPA